MKYFFLEIILNKPGPAQVGAISKAQKLHNFSKKLHTQKNGPSGAPGSASASPWRAKGGTLPKLSTFLSQLKGDPSEKKKFSKKISQCRKTERGDSLWDFKHPICCKISKKLKGEKFLFSEKNLTVPKKTVRGTLWDFPTSILTQDSKKMKGGPFGEKIFRKKSLAVPKKMKGETLWSRPVWYVTRKNRKNFLVQFARPNSAIWCNNIL